MNSLSFVYHLFLFSRWWQFTHCSHRLAAWQILIKYKHISTLIVQSQGRRHYHFLDELPNCLILVVPVHVPSDSLWYIQSIKLYSESVVLCAVFAEFTVFLFRWFLFIKSVWVLWVIPTLVSWRFVKYWVRKTYYSCVMFSWKLDKLNI